MAFLNSLMASSSQPRSASSMPRELCSSERTPPSCPFRSRAMPIQITRKGAAGFQPGRPSWKEASARSVAAGRRVLAEGLEVLAGLHPRLDRGVAGLVAGEAVGGAGEQLADVAAEDRDHADGRNGDQGDDDQVLGHSLTLL